MKNILFHFFIKITMNTHITLHDSSHERDPIDYFALHVIFNYNIAYCNSNKIP
jgi:hypothetical protein